MFPTLFIHLVHEHFLKTIYKIIYKHSRVLPSVKSELNSEIILMLFQVFRVDT